MSANLFYVDLYNRKACKSANGDAMVFPDMVAGGTASFALRFLEYVSGYAEVDQDIASLKVSLGAIDARPVSSQFKIKIGEATTTTANTSAFLDWNVSAAALALALNGLSAKACPFTCEDVSGGIVIRRTDGAAQVFSVVSNRLIPRSFGRFMAAQDDSGWSYEMRLTVAPLAATDSAARVLPDAPSITTIQDGGCDPSGTTFWNEVQALFIPANFRGSYQVAYGTYRKTTLLDSTDGPTQLQDALNAMLKSADGSVLGTVVVTNPTTNTAHIEFKGDLGGVDVAQMTVSVFSAPPSDWTFDLALDKPELFEALRNVPFLTLPFEAEANFYIDPADHGAGTVRRKLWNSTIKIIRPLIYPDMQAVPGVDWLFQNPQDYVPFTPDQIVTGPQTYSAVIGGATTIVVTHGLATSNIANIVVRENTGAWTLKTEGTDYEATITDDNVVTLVFPTAPGAASLIVYVTAAAATRDWEPHTHTIGQIEGLQTILDGYGSAILTLEAILPSTGIAATATQASGITITLPATKEVLFFKGDSKALFGTDGLDATKLPRAPYMLPAVHKSSATSYTTGALPAVAADSVWANNSAGVLDFGRGVFGGKVPVSGFFASDGRVLYAADHSGSTKSYFPTGFDRELFRLFINDKMLRVNRTLDVQFGLALQIAQATSNAQWLLVIESGTAPQDTTPATTATNLQNIVWDAAPLLSQRLILTGNRQTHNFGARIKRSVVATVDTISLDTLLYGVWEGNNAAAPAGANFALRARLIQFDTEDALATDARGWVSYEIIGSTEGGKPTAAIT